MSVLPAYLEQFEQRIQILLVEKKFNDAYKLCIELLNKYPEEKKLAKLKTKIEEEVVANNDKIVKEKINELQPMWKEGKYNEILKELEPLYKIAPSNEKLRRLIIDAQEKYKKQTEKAKEEYKKAQSAKFENMLKDNEAQLLEELFVLEKNNPGNKAVLAITKKFRDQIISKRIKAKQNLIYSEDYEALINFIEQLKKIDKNNKEVISLEQIFKKRKTNTIIENKSEFVYQGREHLITFIKLKKYDKAIKVANELLEVDKENQEIISLLEKAEKKFRNECKKLAINKILENEEILKNDYNSNKDKFIKL